MLFWANRYNYRDYTVNYMVFIVGNFELCYD